MDFWQGFASNLLATIVGVALGIPVAFWINKRVEEITEREKKGKILAMLIVELNNNRNVLVDWQEESVYEVRPKSMYGALLNDEVWNSFSDGGEVQWIKDIMLLGTLAQAYGEIRRIKYLYDAYLHWNTLALNVRSIITQDLTSSIQNALALTDEAREMIRAEVPNL